MAVIEELYREVVLDHYRHPRHREPLADPHGSALLHNPVCGDQVRVEVSLEDGRIREISARARGCSIAVAAGSVMTELVRDTSPAEAAVLGRELERLVSGESPADERVQLDRRLLAFERVADLPSRRRCATLPWEALAEALADASGALA